MKLYTSAPGVRPRFPRLIRRSSVYCDRSPHSLPSPSPPHHGTIDCLPAHRNPSDDRSSRTKSTCVPATTRSDAARRDGFTTRARFAMRYFLSYIGFGVFLRLIWLGPVITARNAYRSYRYRSFLLNLCNNNTFIVVRILSLHVTLTIVMHYEGNNNETLFANAIAAIRRVRAIPTITSRLKERRGARPTSSRRIDRQPRLLCLLPV